MTGALPPRPASAELAEPLKIVIEMMALLPSRAHYFAAAMATDLGDRPIDLRSNQAVRFSLSGALARAVFNLYDNDREACRLRALLKVPNADKRRRAQYLLDRRAFRARAAYGIAWSLLNRMCEQLVHRPMWSDLLSFEDVTRVLQCCRDEIEGVWLLE